MLDVNKQPMQAEGQGLWPNRPIDNAAIEDVADNMLDFNNGAPTPNGPLPGKAFIELNAFLQEPTNRFDLNVALEEDLGGIEDLIQADAMEADGFENNKEQVVIEDVIDVGNMSEDSDNHANQPGPLGVEANIDVEVFFPMQDWEPLQIWLDEIPLEDLIGDPVPHEINQEGHGQEDQLLLGFVELVQPNCNPIFTSRYQEYLQQQCKTNADTIRLWAMFLALGSSMYTVQVLQKWADFFTALLLNPSSFSWAKQFISSQAAHIWMGQLQLPCLLHFQTVLSYYPAQLSSRLASDELSPLSADPKGKAKVNSEQSPPSTPFEMLKHKVSPSTGPQSKASLSFWAAFQPEKPKAETNSELLMQLPGRQKLRKVQFIWKAKKLRT